MIPLLHGVNEYSVRPKCLYEKVAVRSDIVHAVSFSVAKYIKRGGDKIQLGKKING